MATAIVPRPMQGTIYDAQGRVVRDPIRSRAEALLGAFPGSYIGARTDRRALQEWTPLPQSADADSLGDLATLRARSRDLLRNAPLAAGAVNTVITNVVGPGLRPQPRVDEAYLTSRYGVTTEQCDAFERDATRLWQFYSAGRFFDVAGLDTHEQLQAKSLRAVFESGDCFPLRRRKDRAGALFGYCVQLLEADLVCNPDTQLDREGFAGGIESDRDGTPIAYHVASQYEFEPFAMAPRRWTRVPAVGPVSGERLVRHLAWRRRVKQTRGVPYLAVVMEPLKQLDRYGEAELMAAVIAALFTVFIKTEYGGDFLPPLDTDAASALAPKSVGLNVPVPPKAKLGSGGIFQLQPGEDIAIANPARPNTAYDPFVQSKLQEIGAALEIPFEMLSKRFLQSYSAARASRLEFWKFVTPVRGMLAADFCQPDYVELLTEAVASGYLEAPGFFEDPLARHAWTGCWWVGPAMGQIDERGEVEAAVLRIEKGLSTLEEETAALTGGSWEQNHGQQAKERRQRIVDGLIVPATPAEVALAQDANGTAPSAAQRDLQDRQEATANA